MKRILNHADSELTWKAHPAKERTRSAVVATVVILAVATAIYFSFQSLSWSLLSGLVLILTLNRFYFPSSFAIDKEGITAHYPFRRQRYHWNRIRRFLHDQYGGYLSTRKQSSRLDAYRGMHILFGKDREVVVKQIQTHLRDVK